MRRGLTAILVIAMWLLTTGWAAAQVVSQTPEQAAATSLAAAEQIFGGTADC
jgi:hypothetical protein